MSIYDTTGGGYYVICRKCGKKYWETSSTRETCPKCRSKKKKKK